MTSETTTATTRKKASKAVADVSGQEQTAALKRKTASKAAAEAVESQPVAEPAVPKRKRSTKALPAESTAIAAASSAESGETAAPTRKSAKAAKPEVVDEFPLHTEEERRQYIATLAYLRAESRGFAAGNELNDWLEAEAEYHARFKTA